MTPWDENGLDKSSQFTFNIQMVRVRYLNLNYRVKYNLNTSLL